MNEWLALVFTLLYQDITSPVFFHWFSFVDLMIFALILSNVCLLIFLISDLQGFSSLQVGLSLKFGLWSFSVMKACFFAVVSILSLRLCLVAIFLSFIVMRFSYFVGAL